jgi:hypothetical protein
MVSVPAEEPTSTVEITPKQLPTEEEQPDSTDKKSAAEVLAEGKRHLFCKIRSSRREACHRV